MGNNTNSPPPPKKRKTGPLINPGQSKDQRRHIRYVVSKRYPLTLTSIVILGETPGSPKEDPSTDKKSGGNEQKNDQDLSKNNPNVVFKDPIPGYITNINETGIGMGLLSTERIPPLTRIQINLEQLSFSATVIAMVRWCGPLPSTGVVIKDKAPDMKWRLGVEVINPSEEQKKMLKRVVQALIGP